jgi:hypothetical protein
MNRKQKLIAFAFAVGGLAMLSMFQAATSSDAAVRKPHRTPPATNVSPPNQTANADLLKKIADLETRVAELEKGEQGEKPGAQPQIVLQPGHQPPNMLPPTVAQEIASLQKDVSALQSQVTTLQAQVAADALKYESELTNVGNALRTLTQQVTAGGAALQTLQNQFASHTHTLTNPVTLLTDGEMGVQTILHCDGLGQSCSATTPMKDITTFVVTGPPKRTGNDTQTTSGPIFH